MTTAPTHGQQTVEVISTAREREDNFSLGQRFKLFFITWLGFLAIRLICPTLRWNISIEDGGPAPDDRRPMIYTFWHRCVFLATWHFRHRGIVVMTSRSFDGEYIARIIEKFGYGAARGSSHRGGMRALLSMHRDIEAGHSVAFTIDGPKGPMYVAKPGPVLLARNTGAPLLIFHIACDRAWILNSWDRFIIPKPFARATVRIGKLMQVPKSLNSAAIADWHAQMQAELDRVREEAERDFVVRK